MNPSVLKTIFFGSIFLSTISQGCGQDFGYEGSNGPTHWGEKYRHCVGKHQSPINIEEHNVQLVHLPPLIFSNLDWKSDNAVLTNNGHTVIVTLDSNHTPSISGGPLIGNYDFAQLHFHWGANDLEGSENTINNSSYPVELHMVFFQRAYGSFTEATEHPDGLTVLSFLYSKGQDENLKYKSLLNALPLVQNPHSTTTLSNIPFLRDLLPDDVSTYFTYGGSLTTPPCSEVVTWIEFKYTVTLSHDQIEIFRELNSENGKLLHNFRPVQPLHGRTIRMSRNIREKFYEQPSSSDEENSSLKEQHNKLLILFSTFILLLLLSSR